MLLFRVIGGLERIPMPKRDQQSSGWTYLFGGHSQQLQDHSTDSVAFELRRDQTHGLITDRSDRDQQGYIDTIFDQQRYRFGKMISQQSARSGDRSHKREMSMIERADSTGCDELSSPIEG